MWWAEHEFRLQKPQPGGATLGEAFAHYQRESGQRHPEDTGPPVEMPSSLGYLFRWFLELAHGRPIGGMGTMLPIPSTEIAAWQQLCGITLADWEVAALRALDAAYLKIMAEKD